ncbi:hypothetical protein Vretimale_16102 [Volvox reticuliferus]|uniref:Uncharacterized protein n=1 Tax=Volvox reticuliferus TaxID=1737510 RepID=A0A8J4CEY0_9CHLO|nr:hypothetical protein Vretifemale_9673 [Volvox reticuliferus]GIM12870.1 hypothetical protein Vretimale_16102 [Volvox reticuliferus]
MSPADASNGISIIVTFLVLPTGAASSSQEETSSAVMLKPEVAASQLQSSSLVLLQAVSQALGLPASNFVLISVLTSGNVASPPPVSTTAASLPLSQASQPSAVPQPSAVQSAPPSVLPATYPPPMATSSRASPAPVYGSGPRTQSAPSLPVPSQSSAHGTYGDNNDDP